MLGRKQSIKGEPVLADYGPEEAFNESADIEWVNKVTEKHVVLINKATLLFCRINTTCFSFNWFILLLIVYMRHFLEMGTEIDEILCFVKFSISKL